MDGPCVECFCHELKKSLVANPGQCWLQRQIGLKKISAWCKRFQTSANILGGPAICSSQERYISMGPIWARAHREFEKTQSGSREMSSWVIYRVVLLATYDTFSPFFRPARSCPAEISVCHLAILPIRSNYVENEIVTDSTKRTTSFLGLFLAPWAKNWLVTRNRKNCFGWQFVSF